MISSRSIEDTSGSKIFGKQQYWYCTAAHQTSPRPDGFCSVICSNCIFHNQYNAQFIEWLNMREKKLERICK